MNNPSWELYEGTIPTVIKDIQENGTIGTASKRILENIATAVIKDTFFFNDNSRKLRGSGAKLNKFSLFTRKGWRERKNEDYLDEDYDFFGMGYPSVLSENIPVKESIEADFQWDEWEQKDTEAIEYERLDSFFKNALLEELPVIYEKRYIQTILDSINNGVQLLDDKNTGASVFVPQISISYNTEEETKSAIKSLKNVINKLIQLDNFLVYKPNRNKWVVLVNNRFDDALQELGAYQAFGDRIVSNKKTEGYLSNTPIKFIKDSVQVIMLQELPEWIPFIVWPKNESFNNIALLYTAPPTSFKSRADFIGKSASKKFFRIESDSFTNGKISYWATRAELWFVGINGGGAITSVSAWFSNNIQENGTVDVNWELETTASPADITINVWSLANPIEPVATFTPTVVDGTTETQTIANLDSGSYQIEIRINENVDASFPVERQIYASAIYQVRNKGYFQQPTGNVEPPNDGGGEDTPTANVSNVSTTNATSQTATDGAIQFDVNIKHFTSQGTASLEQPASNSPVARSKKVLPKSNVKNNVRLVGKRKLVKKQTGNSNVKKGK